MCELYKSVFYTESHAMLCDISMQATPEWSRWICIEYCRGIYLRTETALQA